MSVVCFFELTTTLCYSISQPIPSQSRLDSTRPRGQRLILDTRFAAASCSQGPCCVYLIAGRRLSALCLSILSLVRPSARSLSPDPCVPLPAPVARCFVPPRLGHPLSLRYAETPIKTLLLPSLQIMDGSRLAPGSRLNAMQYPPHRVHRYCSSPHLGWIFWAIGCGIFITLLFRNLRPPYYQFITPFLPSRNYYIRLWFHSFIFFPH